MAGLGVAQGVFLEEEGPEWSFEGPAGFWKAWKENEMARQNIFPSPKPAPPPAPLSRHSPISSPGSCRGQLGQHWGQWSRFHHPLALYVHIHQAEYKSLLGTFSAAAGRKRKKKGKFTPFVSLL